MTFPPAFGWPFFLFFLLSPIILALIKNKIHSRARILSDNPSTTIQSSWIDKYIKDKSWFSSTIQREIYFGKLTRSISSLRYQSWIIAITVALYSFPHSILITNLPLNQYAYNIIFHLIQLSTLIFFYVTCFMDPGTITTKPIIAYAHHNDDSFQLDETSPLINNDGDMENIDNDQVINVETPKTENSRNSEQARIIEIDADNAPRSYCEHCGFIRPTRSKHCYEIGRCVARFDHFDDLIGNAIGAKNHRFYILLLLLEVVFYLWTDIIVINAIIERANDNPYDEVIVAVFGWTAVIILLIFVVVMGFYKLAMFVLHIRLISVNSTTYEILKPQVVINSMNEINAFHDGSYVQGKGIDLRMSTAVGNEEVQVTGFGNYFNKGFVANWVQCLSGYKEEREWFMPLKCRVNVGKDGGVEVIDDDDDDDDIGENIGN